jgi:hypothetical protein
MVLTGRKDQHNTNRVRVTYDCDGECPGLDREVMSTISTGSKRRIAYISGGLESEVRTVVGASEALRTVEIRGTGWKRGQNNRGGEIGGSALL